MSHHHPTSPVSLANPFLHSTRWLGFERLCYACGRPSAGVCPKANMPACRRHLGDPDRAFAEAAREIALERAREIFPNLTSVAKWETPGGQPPVDDLTTQLHILVITNRIKQGEAIKRGDLVGYLLSAGYLPVREPIDPHRGFDDVDEVDDSAYPECHPPLAFLP